MLILLSETKRTQKDFIAFSSKNVSCWKGMWWGIVGQIKPILKSDLNTVISKIHLQLENIRETFFFNHAFCHNHVLCTIIIRHNRQRPDVRALRLFESLVLSIIRGDFTVTNVTGAEPWFIVTSRHAFRFQLKSPHVEIPTFPCTLAQ